jgi:hypothetical protein
MEELSLAVKIIMVIFGLGGIVALSVVPWLCIGDGIFGKEKEHRSKLK